MDKLKFAILNICVPVAVSVFVFISIYTNGFCSALEQIDATSSAFEVIQGGANKSNGFYYTLTPEMYGTLGPMAIDELNAELYSKYGWDLETIQIDGADDWTNGVDPQVSTQFGYKVLGQNLANLAQTTLFKISTGLGTMFGIGEKNNNDQLSVVHNGSVYYVDSDTIDKVKSTRSELINSGEFTVIEDNKPIYSSHVQINSVRNSTFGDNTVIRLDCNTNVPICYYTFNRSPYYNNVWALVPKSALSLAGNLGDIVRYTLPCSGFYITANGQKHVMNTLQFYYQSNLSSSYVSNGVEYYVLEMAGETGNLASSYTYGNGTQARNIIDTVTANGNTEKSTATFYYYSNEQAMDSLLSQLEGKFVTTDDMQRIIDAINNLQYGLISDNGTTLPVIDTNAEAIANLQAIINDILANEQTLADVLNKYNTEPAPEPEPEPEPYNNQGIAVPPDFNNNIITNVSNIFGLPLQFVSMFSPIFKIFGANVPLFGLWLFFPIVLIIGVIIWVLK